MLCLPVCLKAGLRRVAQAEGSAGTRGVCWEHLGRGRNRENESGLRVGKRRERNCSNPWKTRLSDTSHSVVCWLLYTIYTILPSCLPKWSTAKFLQLQTCGYYSITLKILFLLTSVYLLSESLLVYPHITDFCLFLGIIFIIQTIWGVPGRQGAALLLVC